MKIFLAPLSILGIVALGTLTGTLYVVGLLIGTFYWPLYMGLDDAPDKMREVLKILNVGRE